MDDELPLGARLSPSSVSETIDLTGQLPPVLFVLSGGYGKSAPLRKKLGKVINPNSLRNKAALRSC